MRARPSRGRARLATAALVAAASILGATNGQGHEAHVRTKAVSTDSASAAHDSAARHEAGPEARRVEAAEPPFEMPPMEDMFFHHVHNKVIHLPIVLAPVALVLLLAERRRPTAVGAAPYLVWAAALSSAAALLSGRAQEGAFHGGPKEWLVGRHEAWGIAAVVALFVWSALTAWPAARRHAWIGGAIATLLTMIAALYGGLVAHG